MQKEYEKIEVIIKEKDFGAISKPAGLLMQKHPRYGIAIILILIITSILFRFHVGYDWGPHKVREGETLSGIMVRALSGNTFLGYAAINNLKDEMDVHTIWKNNQTRIQDGDIVQLKGNNFILIKPNSQKIQIQLFPDESYKKRIAQVIYYNLFIVILSTISILLIFSYARGDFSKKQMNNRSTTIAAEVIYTLAFIGWGLLILLIVPLFMIAILGSVLNIQNTQLAFMGYFGALILILLFLTRGFLVIRKWLRASKNPLPIIIGSTVLFSMGATILYMLITWYILVFQL